MLFAFYVQAQAPQKFSYQTVIRNASNQLLVGQTVGIKISILQGSANGIAVYAETHAPQTNANGLANVEIGGGSLLSGNFANINWANGPFFVKTETDPNGGNNYTITNTSQLLSVPYALFSSSSNTANNGVPAGGTNGQFLTNCNGVATWTTAGQCPGTIASLNCAGTSNIGTLTADQLAASVSCNIPYTGGGGGTHNGQTVTSTGITGLNATLTAGTFANGAGSLTYTITGTPSSSGTASFALSIGGQSCTLTRTVNSPIGAIASLNCSTSNNSGTLAVGVSAIGVNNSVPYTGGNGGTYIAQSITSTGVIGLTASLSAGTFASGAGSLTYIINGTPSSIGTASFALSIGGQSCTLTRTVTVGAIASLNCSNAYIGDDGCPFQAGTPLCTAWAAVSYTSGNGGSYPAQTVNSTGVTGITATLAAGNFANGSGSLYYNLSGTPNTAGTAILALNIGGQSCSISLTINSNGQTGITAHTCGATNVHNPAKTYGTMTDQQGNVYKTIVIGSQEWMAENLKTTSYRNGNGIEFVTDSVQWASLITGAWSYYNNDDSYDCPYGKLYNWHTVVDPRNLCPAGWHVPSRNEWITLTSYLGGEGVVAGGKMGSSNNQIWFNPDASTNNESGFSGLPSFSMGQSGAWWSTTLRSLGDSWLLWLGDQPLNANIWYLSKQDGLSVRCLRD